MSGGFFAKKHFISFFFLHTYGGCSTLGVGGGLMIKSFQGGGGEGMGYSLEDKALIIPYNYGRIFS